MVDLRASQVALPRERRFYTAEETTYGVRVQPVGADAIKILNAVIGSPQPVRTERVDNRQTRSIESQITGATPPIPWSVEGYLIPSGAAGTGPDFRDIFKAGLGPVTIVGATSATFNPTDVQGELLSLTIVDELSGIMMESLAGCWCEEFTMRGTGGEPVMISASGLGSTHVLTGRAEVVSVVAALVTVSAAQRRHVEVGSNVQFLDVVDGITVLDDNGGAGFVVLSLDSATTYTLNASPAGVAALDIIAPFVPTEVTAGNPATGIVGSVTIDSLTLPVQSWEVTVKNNIQPHADEAFQANTTGFHEDMRQVTGQVTLRAHADQLIQLEKRKEFTALAFSLVIGATAGSIITISGAGAELGFADVDKSQPESAIITLPFKLLGTGNEIAIAFT